MTHLAANLGIQGLRFGHLMPTLLTTNLNDVGHRSRRGA